MGLVHCRDIPTKGENIKVKASLKMDSDQDKDILLKDKDLQVKAFLQVVSDLNQTEGRQLMEKDLIHHRDKDLPTTDPLQTRTSRGDQ